MPNTIADNLLRLQTARTNIANAITTMGGTVATGDGFEDFPSEILALPVPTLEVCELIKSSGIAGNVYGFNTPDRTIVAGVLYYVTSSNIVLTFPQGFTPSYTKSLSATYSVYYAYGYAAPYSLTSLTITNSTISLTLNGFNSSNQTKQVPICLQFNSN